ncbi:MAG: cell surface protein SprA, partial [Chryseolinea sp.]
GSTIPDNEDLNGNNTINTTEEYYEYDIDLVPGQLAIGKEYITDQILTTNDNVAKERVTWYQFRIPVRQFESKFGNIDGFKSIKYVRMLLTGFKDPVVLRFANFRLVGSRWRRYTANLLQDGLVTTPEISPDNFVVSVVNLEENSSVPTVNPGAVKEKSPYRIPPGVVRDRDNTSTVSRLLNEQSIQVCIDDLNDGDARAIYKNVSADLFNYGRVKMFFHANSASNDDDMHAFLRLGTDFDQNYYEIEIPLKITKPANTQIEREIWPEANEIDLDLDELYALKAERDRGGFSLYESFPVSGPKQVGRHLIRIFGRPDLSSVQLMMIGVKNPRTSDKRPHSVCLWANELRLTDFNRTPGWAVNTTLSAKLADFATVTGTFRHTTFGFGSVSSKIFERTREETTAYDLSTTVNLDKLIPGNTGIKIPMFLSYQNTTKNPGYDPANPDMKLDALKKSFSSDEAESAYLKLIQDVESRRSLNFVNVRKVKTKPNAKTHIYDIENFSLSYSYSDRLRTNFTTKESKQEDQKGSIAYNFSPKATGIEPFKNSKALKSPWLKLIKDFNFSFLPSSLSVRFDLDRSFGKNIYRNDGGSLSTPAYLKYFTFNRQYNLRWNLTKALSLEYASRAYAIIDEPDGDIDTQEKKDIVINNLKKFGRMKNFEQNITLNYTLPLDKLPVTDWLGADYRYQVNYNWKAGPLNKPDKSPGQPDGLNDIPDDLDFKNIIDNKKTQNLTGRVDLLKLYNKVKFLKEINTPPKPVPARKSTNPTVKPPPDTVRTTPPLIKGIAKLIMSVRSINGSYERSEGTILPGYSGTPKFFGMDENWKTPGWGFVLGDQNPNIRTSLAEAGYLTKNSGITTPFSQARTDNFNLRANIEPTADLKIQIDLKKESSSSYQEIYRYNLDSARYESLNPNRSGSYRISYLTIKTAFEKSNDETESSVFKKFEENLIAIKDRFNFINGGGELYDTTSQDVIIPAFIAAYSGKNVNTISLTPFQKTPLPNWRLDYTGLNKLKGFKDIFQSVTVSHAYQSSYSVLNYSNSLEFNDPNSQDYLSIDHSVEDYNSSYFGKSVDGKLIPMYVISQVLISEQFSPLIGISIRTKSKITANFQYKTKRDLALNISNAQITEQTSKDVSFEMGFTKTGMKLPFKSQGRTIVLKNDLTFKLNATVSDQKTIQRKVDELNIITNGNVNYQIKPSLNYTVSQKLSIQLYYDRTINDPVVSSSYRRTTTRFGAQVRFSLAQ